MRKSQLKRIIREAIQFAATAQEEAEKVNAQAGPGPYGMSLVTDQEFWEEQGIFTGEELAISLLSQSYSDLHKEIHGVRARGGSFSSVEEAQAAIARLEEYYQWELEQEKIDAERQAKIEKERQELEALMPGEFDFENVPRRSGMGRRVAESVASPKKTLRMTRNDITTIVKNMLEGK